MTDQLSMFDLPTSPDTPNVTSSPGSADGRLPCASLDGLTTGPSGRDHARASHSPALGLGSASKILATSGPPGSGSSASDALQSSLESSLRERLTGSDLCEVTWRPWVTPWGQSRCKPRARERVTSGTGIGLLPTLTATANMLAPSMRKWPLHARLIPTLTARDWKSCSPGTQGNSRPLSEHIPGPINPAWAASHMGYPPEWLSCAPSAMRLSRKSRRSSSAPTSTNRDAQPNDGQRRSRLPKASPPNLPEQAAATYRAEVG